MQLNDQQLTEIHALLQSGQKTEAVKLYRQFAHAGHFEATDAVNEIEAQLVQQKISASAASNIEKEEPFFQINNINMDSAGPFDANADIRLMCLQGKTAEAVQKYAERYGVNPQQAQQAVNTMMQADGSMSVTSAYAFTDATEEYWQLCAQGRKIEAVKLYRDKTGASLSTAKAFIDAIEERRTPPALSPQNQYSTGDNTVTHKQDESIKGPGTGFILLMVILVLGLVYWLVAL